MEIKTGKSKSISKVIVTEKKAVKSCKELSKQEQEFVLTCHGNKENGIHINRLNEHIFVVIADEPNHKNNDALRKTGAEICKKANKIKLKDIRVHGHKTAESNVLLVAEGLALANYSFTRLFSKPEEKTNSLTGLYIEASDKAVEKLLIVVEATYIARDLVNLPVSHLNATQLAGEFVSMGKAGNFKVEVLNQNKIKALKMGGILAVNQGSLDPATFSIMEWKPAKAKNKKPIVLVGKGIVYDTGGLSLKPTPNSMDIMKCDMAGAATMAATLYAVAKAKLPIHLIALVPATDNRPGGNAITPGDVITMFDGTTVEVMNTDAEGRLVLADALTYAKKYNPELVIDAATLTGASVRALGNYAIAGMGNLDSKIKSRLIASSFNVYERIADCPFWDDYAEEIKSSIADLKNLGKGEAGHISAGKFLEHFTSYPWYHLDIAARAWNDTVEGYRPKGGTGEGVRLLFDFLNNY
ncbi:MAG: leucyl aminopeptidase family protein [Flavobacteriales bacterium]